MDFLHNPMRKVRVFLEMIKFEHSVFALPFAYLGLFLATEGRPGWSLFIGVSAAMVSFRTMAMGVNRLIDRKIDALNPRTQNRALPQGKLSPGFTWTVTLLALFIFEIVAYWLAPICFYLSPIPVFLAFLYPWTKRFTWLCHAVLGFVLGIAPYGAWLAAGREFSWIPGFLTLGVTAWVMGFDIIYALLDMTFDQSAGLHSIPQRWGIAQSLVITRFLHIIAATSWLAVGILKGFGFPFGIGWCFVVVCLVRENWLIKKQGMEAIQEAFFNLNALISTVLFVAVWIDLLL